MVTRHDIVETALGYVDTPWVHQGRRPGVALDCVGVAICVARELGLVAPIFDVSGYSAQPDEALFLRLLRDHMDELPPGAGGVGDAIAFRLGHIQHLAIAVGLDPLRIVHAYRPVGEVRAHRCDAAWERRARIWFRFRGVSG